MENVVKFINKYYQFDFDKTISRKSFSGTLQDFARLYDQDKALVQMKLAVDAGYLEVVAIKAKRFLYEIASQQVSSPVKKILDKELTRRQLSARINRLLKMHEETDAVINASALTNEELLSYEAAFDDVIAGTTTFFQFTPGQFTYDTKLLTHKAIVVSSTNRNIIDSLPETAPGETMCYVVFKIEPELAYSHFIFAFVSGSTKIIATDKMLFATPNIAERSRNPWRRAEKKFDTGMPYAELLNLVENSTAVVSTAGQFYDIFKIEDCKDGGVYVRSFAQMIYRVLVSSEIKNVTWSTDIKTKLIGSGESPADAPEQDTLTGWGIASKKRFEEIIEANETVRHLPAIVSYNIDAVRDDDWFDTPENLKRRAVYMALEESRIAIQSSLPRAERIKEDLNDFAVQRAEFIRERLLSAQKIYWVQDDYSTNNEAGNHFNLKQGKSRHVFTLSELSERKDLWPDMDVSIYQGSRYDRECICPITGAKANVKIVATLKSSDAIAWLFGVEKSELPQFWKAYKHHSLLPYTGNSILDSVHPHALVYDLASERYPNGVNLVFYLSKSGYKKIMKDKPDANTVVYDADTKQTFVMENQAVERSDQHGAVINFFKG